MQEVHMTESTWKAGLLVMALAAGSAAAGEPAAKAAAAASLAGIPAGIVDGAAARKLVASGVKVVDVRTREEFTAGHVPGAINIPYDEMEKRYAEIGPSSTPVLVYCRTGHRSGIAAKTLRERGYSTLFDLQKYDRWVDSEPKR
jgi:rhodanese-related sulfurtransferase